MKAEQTPLLLRSFDWRWLLVTYCFLILFDLFPLSLALGTVIRPLQFWWFTLLAVGGMVIISGYVGFRSRGITLFEPAVASALCTLTLLVAIRSPWRIAEGYHLVAFWVALLVFAFVAGFGGAAVGGWLQLRREKRQALALKE